MEYLHDHKSFSDVPYDLLLKKYAYYYPALIQVASNVNLDDLHTEIKSDMKQ